MTFKNRMFIGDSMTTANLKAALTATVAAGDIMQKGLTSANLQAALAPAPAPSTPSAPAQPTTGSTSTGSKSG